MRTFKKIQIGILRMHISFSLSKNTNNRKKENVFHKAGEQ